MSTWESAPAVNREPAPLDADAYALGRSLRSLMVLGAMTSPRSRQATLGSSEAGHPCDRRISYRLHQLENTNVPDPLRAMVGSGFHAQMGDVFTRLNAGAGRFLIEARASYRGIPGTVDLFDRYEHTVIDWKTTVKSKLAVIRRDGPTTLYIVQSQLYAAALDEQGEDVRTVALVFIPVDGTLDDVYVWRRPYDKAIADEAVDRVRRLEHIPPWDAQATPDRLCPWCAHYLKGSTDLRVGCPGA